MDTYVALLRGINIGPNKRIKMEPLRQVVADLGFADVQTLVNSGNVVFTGEGSPAEIARRIEGALVEHHNLDVPVVVRTAAELEAVIAANPFPEVAVTPKLLHVWFLEGPLDPAVAAKIKDLETADDRLHPAEREVYLHAPHGLSGASQPIQTLDRMFRTTATARNWNTVTRLAEMASR